MTILRRLFDSRPIIAPAAVAARVGRYGKDEHEVDVSEREGALYVQQGGLSARRLIGDGYTYVAVGGGQFVFASGAPSPSVTIDGAELPRHDSGAELVAAFQRMLAGRVTMDLSQMFPRPNWVSMDADDLVEIGRVDERILIDMRYASAQNFTGRAIYPIAVAVLRRNVAEALSRVETALREIGLGLVVYDAYRPWSITKLFWDLVPPDARGFVADPATGSKHNRGCAVDVTMRDMSDGATVEMPSRFDEPSARSAADYAGGTGVQRWRRDLLRLAMEREGFVVQPDEWWHFDHWSWRGFPVLDVGLNHARNDEGRSSDHAR
jgi:D-alanyl-D-alanine dipeptidase